MMLDDTLKAEVPDTTDSTTGFDLEDNNHLDAETAKDIVFESPEDVAQTTSKEEEGDENLDSPPLFKFVRERLSAVLYVVAGLCIVSYSLWAFIVDFERARPLLIVESFLLGYFIIRHAAKHYFSHQLLRLEEGAIAFFASLEHRWLPAVIVIVGMIVAAALLVEEARNLISGLGLIAFVLLSYLTSWKPGRVNWRPVLGGIVLQFVLAVLILKTSAGYSLFEFFSSQITTLLNYTYAGSSFVYGYLVDTSLFGTALQTVDGGAYYLSPPLYFNVLSTIFFFGALISICHYLGIVAWIMTKIGYILALVMGTSATETLSATANIFLGQSEAPLMIQSFLNDMTNSELHAVMTAGFATVAGSVLAAYSAFGIDATHLLSASVMSAPAALAISKLVYPETLPSKTGSGIHFEVTQSTDSNMIEAAANGASLAIHLVLNIGAQLIAFLALVAMLDGFLGGIGGLVDVELSFESICSYLFYPFAWLMGVPSQDCLTVASLLGAKIFLNEFVAYSKLSEHLETLNPKSVVIATYALCGFSNFGSIGVQLGGLTPLLTSPTKAKSLNTLVFSAMIAGNTACFMTACIAGLLYDSNVVEER